jgi:hypothetical protein
MTLESHIGQGDGECHDEGTVQKRPQGCDVFGASQPMLGVGLRLWRRLARGTRGSQIR